MKPCKLVAGHFDADGACPSALTSMCQSSVYDVITVDFNSMFGGGGGGTPADAARFCQANPTNTNLCQGYANSVQLCQTNGKKVLLSLSGSANFGSDAAAKAYAVSIWNAFLGGRVSGVWRPFGNVVLDGMNLLVSSGSVLSGAAFANTLRASFVVAQKSYYVGASPLCIFPDANLGPDTLLKRETPLQSGWFDYVFVRFTSSTCGIQLLGTTGFNADQWGAWARGSLNPGVQVFLGVNSIGANANAIWNATVAMTANLKFGGIFIKDAAVAICKNNAVLGTVGLQMHSGC